MSTYAIMPLRSGGLTLEFSGREDLRAAAKLTDDIEAESAPLQ